MAYIEGGAKSLVLVRGVSGSGKSTFAKEFIYPASLLIATDDFFMNNGEYEFNPKLLYDNHIKCINSVESEMKNPSDDIITNIVVHNTFTENWEIKPYQELAEKYGYNFYTIIIENRHGTKSIHDVPEHVISSQKDRFDIVL